MIVKVEIFDCYDENDRPEPFYAIGRMAKWIENRIDTVGVIAVRSGRQKLDR
jgi:hypothetical protein